MASTLRLGLRPETGFRRALVTGVLTVGGRTWRSGSPDHDIRPWYPVTHRSCGRFAGCAGCFLSADPASGQGRLDRL